MDDENDVLFVRGSTKNTNSSLADEDVWDDSALIKAYDKAVNLAKDEVARRMGMEVIEGNRDKMKNLQNHEKGNQHRKPCRKWTVGSPCRAVYSIDGEVYEAIVTKVYKNCPCCIVKFVGYGNTEKVEMSNLLESDGLESQIAQQKRATAFNESQESSVQSDSRLPFETRQTNGSANESMEYESEKPRPARDFNPGVPFNWNYGAMPPAPPIPPHLMAKLPENDADALSSMLMSWYISGFHTGYYHGMKQARNIEEKRKKL